MAALTIQTSLLGGVVKAALVAATAGGDTFVNEGKTIFEVVNGGGSSITVTVTGQRLLHFDTSATKTVTVGAGDTTLIGPFPVGNFNVEATEAVSITYSGVTTVTVGVFSFNDEWN
ncbi:MAG: hypothetical protein V3S69_06600 [Dehalococcoidales bacterium]